jgi:hypothetical protein
MTPKELVASLKRKIVDVQMTHYMRFLAEAHAVSDDRYTQWPRLSKTYRQLSDDEKRALEWGLRQSALEALSGVLGVLDGSVLLQQYRGEFHLFYDEDGQQLNGELQDLLLADQG